MSSWDTPTYWVLGIIFGAVLYKGLDLMFSTERQILGVFMAAFGTVGLLLTIPTTRMFLADTALALYRRVGVPYPKVSLIVVMLIGAAVFGGAWLLLPNLERASGKVPVPESPNLVGGMAVALQAAKDPRQTRAQMTVTVTNRGGTPSVVRNWVFGWRCGKKSAIVFTPPLYPINEKDETKSGLIDEGPSKKIIIQPGGEAQYTLRYTIDVSIQEIGEHGLDLELQITDVMNKVSVIEDHTPPTKSGQ